MISSEELSKIWTEVVDFVRDSQIKCAADLEYLKYGDPTGPVYLQTFTSKKMRRVVEFCNDWLLLGIENIEMKKIIQIQVYFSSFKILRTFKECQLKRQFNFENLKK